MIEGNGRFYVDCEFDGHGGPLLSMALVREDGDGIHIGVTDVYDVKDQWVERNVIPVMGCHEAPRSLSLRTSYVGQALRDFIEGVPAPIIIADSPVDIGRFCTAISTAPDGGWASADYPRMTFEVHNVDCYPTDLPGAVQHNAWWDAMALRHVLRPTPPATPEPTS